MNTAVCGDDLPRGSVPETLATLSAQQLAEMAECVEMDEQSSPEARRRLAEHIDREQQRRIGG